jgi:hypothetical protein
MQRKRKMKAYLYLMMTNPQIFGERFLTKVPIRGGYRTHREKWTAATVPLHQFAPYRITALGLPWIPRNQHNGLMDIADLRSGAAKTLTGAIYKVAQN